MSADKQVDGLVILQSNRGVDEVLARLRQSMAVHNLKIFAELDFSSDAAAQGLQLRPTRMLIVGSPKAGTPIIEAVPTVAIDLPLKVLVWSEVGGPTSVAYNDPNYVGRRHGLPPELVRNIAGLGMLVEKAAADGP